MKIYQLKDEHTTLMFRGHDVVAAHTGDERLDRRNYDCVWSEPDSDMDLEDIFSKFNTCIPYGYTGRSMSVGDLIERFDGLWFCEPFGFKAVEWKPEDDEAPSILDSLLADVQKGVIELGAMAEVLEGIVDVLNELNETLKAEVDNRKEGISNG